MKPYKSSLLMAAGEASYKQLTIPGGYRFLSLINNTPNTIDIYQQKTTDEHLPDVLVRVPPYTQQTVPIDESREFTFFYSDGGGLETKKSELIFSVDNLGLQGPLGTIVSGTITIGVDGVGLAKQAQLPGALTGAGNLKTAIQEDNVGLSLAAKQDTIITHLLTIIGKLDELIAKP